MMSRVSSQSQPKKTSDELRPLTPQERHARQRELVKQSLSACPTAKKPQNHRRWA